MKYILMCTLALLLCFALGAVIVFAINKVRKKAFPRIASILLSGIFGVCLLVIASVGYLSIYYHAEENALNEVFTNPNVSYSSISGGSFIDGYGEDTALILYPGAKVESKSYFYFASMLAENGIDVFIADFPFNVAFFSPDMADQFVNNYTYHNWIIAGHSMGGVLACNYANNHPDLFTNIVLLASYPTATIKDEISLLSIYGDMDGCLGKDVYEKSKEYWPINSRELCIEGGNHAQFANYGEQKGDGTASISSLEQKELTVNAILEFVK